MDITLRLGELFARRGSTEGEGDGELVSFSVESSRRLRPSTRLLLLCQIPRRGRVSPSFSEIYPVPEQALSFSERLNPNRDALSPPPKTSELTFPTPSLSSFTYAL